MDYEVIMI